MKYIQSDSNYILKIEQEEDALSTLTQFCSERAIASASFTAIGAVSWVECGYYDLANQKYLFTQYDELLEVVSCIGNVTEKEGELFAHTHGVFSRADNTTFGGHVNEMKVGVVLEVHLTAHPLSIKRTLDQVTGLYLMDL